MLFKFTALLRNLNLIFGILLLIIIFRPVPFCFAEPISAMCDGIRGWYSLDNSERSAEWNAALSLDVKKNQVSDALLESAISNLQQDLQMIDKAPSLTEEATFLSKWKSEGYDPVAYDIPHTHRYIGVSADWLLPKGAFLHASQLEMACGIQCYKAIEALNGETQIRYSVGSQGYGLTLLPRVVWELASNKRYQRALRRTVALLGSKLKSINLNSSQIDLGNFFDDLISSGENEGMTFREAQEFAWNSVAIYGANAEDIFVIFDDIGPTNANNFSTLISFAAYAQSLTKSAHEYFLPKNVQTTCALGKEYHFWLAAYLTHVLLERGFSMADTSKAVYAYSSLYEFAAPTNGREDAFSEFAYGFPRSGYIQSVRLDLAYTAAGILFGGSKSEVNLDSIIGSFYENVPIRIIEWGKHPLFFQRNLGFAEVSDYLKVVEPELIFHQISIQ
jgi:hypothetical protein